MCVIIVFVSEVRASLGVVSFFFSFCGSGLLEVGGVGDVSCVVLS